MSIFYLAYLANLNGENRFCSPAANNVCSYIKDVLIEDGKNDVTIINLAQNKKHFIFSQSRVTLLGNKKLVNSPCFGSGRLLSKLSMFLLFRWIKKYLKNNASSDDKIIVYHSLNTLKMEKMISKEFDSVLQVEEIYCDVLKKQKNKALREINVINSFKKHIFVSSTLKDDSRIKSSFNLIFYGSYSLPTFKNSFERDQKSIVYAGTFEKNKGIEFACDLMKLLPDYKLFIYGHGSKTRIEELIAKYKDFTNICFCGQLSEAELNDKLPLYKYGISPLDPKTSFSSTTFPSKILTYLKSGLIVISSKFESVIESPFKNCILFANYDIQSFHDVIVSSLHREVDGRDVIKKLDVDFRDSLFGLIYEK